jgi:galacturan 1,4-alpha-galacturonidase
MACASVTASNKDVMPVGASMTYPRSLTSLYARLPGFHTQPKRDNWGNHIESDRKRVTIRASKNDRDDVSQDFLWALKEANHGGLVHLKKGKKYVIGKKLDLTFLDDVYVKLDGELKVGRSNAYNSSIAIDR